MIASAWLHEVDYFAAIPNSSCGAPWCNIDVTRQRGKDSTSTPAGDNIRANRRWTGDILCTHREMDMDNSYNIENETKKECGL